MTTHLKPRTTTVVLYQGDDMDQLAHLKRAADIAERQLKDREREAAADVGTARAGDDTSDEIVAAEAALGAARDAFDTFVVEAEGRALFVVLESIGLAYFRDLLAEHPPRMVKRPVVVERAVGDSTAPTIDGPDEVEHEDDAGYGVNTQTFPKALLTFRKTDDEGDEPQLFATIAQPEFSSVAKVERFLDREVAEGDFDQLWLAAYWLNRSPTTDPKGAAFRSAFLSTDET